jgi:AcrR family transcriptional regulator
MRPISQRRPLALPNGSDRSKRAAILDAAADQFGRQGFDGTKWADVAAGVGIGQTALYYYFESKVHCLFTIMADALAEARRRFEATTSSASDHRLALEAAVLDAFDLTEADVFRRRILIGERQRLAVHYPGRREEESRQLARDRIREIEVIWITFLARGMERGAFKQQDPELLARALLGLINSAFEWYRPGGSLRLTNLGRFYTDGCLRLVLE